MNLTKFTHVRLCTPCLAEAWNVSGREKVQHWNNSERGVLGSNLNATQWCAEPSNITGRLIPGRRRQVQKRIRSERTRTANLPFSDAVWAGDTLYLSGHLGL